MTKYVTHSVPSTAERIKAFLEEPAMLRLGNYTNYTALTQKLPGLIKSAAAEAQNEIEYGDLDPGGYRRIQDAIPDGKFINRIIELAGSLHRVATTGKCSIEDQAIIGNYDSIFEPLEVFAGARLLNMEAAQRQLTKRAVETAGGEDQAISDKAYAKANSLKMLIEYDHSVLNFVQSLKVGIKHLAVSLDAEIKNEQQRGRA